MNHMNQLDLALLSRVPLPQSLLTGLLRPSGMPPSPFNAPGLTADDIMAALYARPGGSYARPGVGGYGLISLPSWTDLYPPSPYPR